MESFNAWLLANEHIWLFWQLNAEIVIGLSTLIVCLIMNRHEKLSVEWLKREFEYDYEKDTKRKKRSPKVAVDSVEGGNVCNQCQRKDQSGEEKKGGEENAG